MVDRVQKKQGQTLLMVSEGFEKLPCELQCQALQTHLVIRSAQTHADNAATIVMCQQQFILDPEKRVLFDTPGLYFMSWVETTVMHGKLVTQKLEVLL